MSIWEAFQIDTLAEPVDFAPGIPAGSSGRLFIHVSASWPELTCEPNSCKFLFLSTATSGIHGSAEGEQRSARPSLSAKVQDDDPRAGLRGKQ